MPLNSKDLDRRVRKLRKSLKGFSRNPTVDEVHDLRTRTRRLESILHALDMESCRDTDRLLEQLKAVRKRAGKVRDMDVLTAHILGMDAKGDTNCVVRLVHHLGGKRERQASKLSSVVRRQASDLRHRLKRSSKDMEKVVDKFADTKFDLDSASNGESEEAPLHAMSLALRLSKELAGVRRLGRNNLHSYRIEVKRLRYVLEMAEHTNGTQKELIEELRKVQDAIGEWHDWLQLAAIAEKVLRHNDSCVLLKKIQETADKRFGQALEITQQMRRRYLLQSSQKRSSSPGAKRSLSAIAAPVLVAASEIAA